MRIPFQRRNLLLSASQRYHFNRHAMHWWRVAAESSCIQDLLPSMRLQLGLLLLAKCHGFVTAPQTRRLEPLSVAFGFPEIFPSVDGNLLANLGLAGALGFGVDPLVEIVWNGTHPSREEDSSFRNTFTYGAADSIAVAARLYGGLILVGAFTDHFPGILPVENLLDKAPLVASTVWAALTVSAVKRTLFVQRTSSGKLGRVALYDRLIDFVIGIVTVVEVLDELQIDVGMGVASVLSASGVGALIFSLASKDLAEQIVAGLTISVWDAIEVGEDVKLGDGTAGTITRIGLVDTDIEGFDNVVVRIPNAQIATSRVSNLSRISKSRVTQTLRFKYADLDKLPVVLQETRQEIKANCPELIVDGSKPFRAVLSSYQSDHVEAEVTCHFALPPGSDAYCAAREKVLLAIATAAKHHDVEFALPSILYTTTDGIPMDSMNTN